MSLAQQKEEQEDLDQQEFRGRAYLAQYIMNNYPISIKAKKCVSRLGIYMFLMGPGGGPVEHYSKNTLFKVACADDVYYLDYYIWKCNYPKLNIFSSDRFNLSYRIDNE